MATTFYTPGGLIQKRYATQRFHRTDQGHLGHYVDGDYKTNLYLPSATLY